MPTMLLRNTIALALAVSAKFASVSALDTAAFDPSKYYNSNAFDGFCFDGHDTGYDARSQYFSFIRELPNVDASQDDFEVCAEFCQLITPNNLIHHVGLQFEERLDEAEQTCYCLYESGKAPSITIPETFPSAGHYGEGVVARGSGGTHIKCHPYLECGCDCRITNVNSLSNFSTKPWGAGGDADKCGAPATDGWDFELCLQTSDKGPRGAEQTTGTITLKSPTSCADTPDEIVCVIDKFRVNPYPDWPLSKWSGPSIKVAGTASYDAGSGPQVHSCAVLLGKVGDIDAAIQFTLLPVGENTYHEWMYNVNYPASADRFRDFNSETSTGTISTAYTDISSNIVQELNLCGLVAPENRLFQQQ